MKRVSLLTGLFVLCAVAPAVAQPATPPSLRVKVKRCNGGASPLSRSAVFEGSMPREAPAVSMGMRFKLYESIDGSDFERVVMPGFSSWIKSAPNVAGLVFDKRVNQLPAPAVYRVVVDFAWYDEEGKVIDHTRRTSKTCRQPAG